MKAAYFDEHGPVERLKVGEQPRPSVKAGEVLVQVRAAALNHLDIWVRRGRRPLPTPHVPGSDGAGVIAEVGEGVEGVQAGQEVVIYPGLHCGHCRYCDAGEHSLCEQFGIVGFHRWGTYAEYVALPAACVLPKPPHLDWPSAAALTLAHLTAWRMLMTRAQTRPGERVLIHGIGGGVAMAALQLARQLGAETIVTSSSNEKLSRAVQLGAGHTVNYSLQEDRLGEDIVRLTHGQGVDVVIDAVGAATWGVNFQVIRRGGRIVHCGITTGEEAPASIQAIYWNQVSVLGSTLGGLGECRDMLRAVAIGHMQPVVDTVAPLEAIRDQTERMERGEQIGKLVMEISR